MEKRIRELDERDAARDPAVIERERERKVKAQERKEAWDALSWEEKLEKITARAEKREELRKLKLKDGEETGSWEDKLEDVTSKAKAWEEKRALKGGEESQKFQAERSSTHEHRAQIREEARIEKERRKAAAEAYRIEKRRKTEEWLLKREWSPEKKAENLRLINLGLSYEERKEPLRKWEEERARAL